MNNGFIPQLKDFINREQNAQNSEIVRIWQQPVGSRVAEGECIAQVEVVERTQFRATLHCDENLSKFRVGDTMRLSQGDPQKPVCSCELLEEQGNRMTVGAGLQ